MKNAFFKICCSAIAGDFSLNVEFSLTENFTALFGRSGCGKTSTLKLIAGLIRPESGILELAGRTLCDVKSNVFIKPEKRDVGLVFQEARLFPHLTIEENLEFGAKNVQPHEQRFSKADVVERIGVSHLLHRMPRHLSGGETQRVAIARALLASPKLLLMDEPLAAIDAPTKINLLFTLKKFSRDLNLPIIYVSHDVGDVLNLASEVILMDGGKAVRQGAPLKVLQDFAAKSIGGQETVRNIFEAEVESHNASAGTTTVRVAEDRLILPELDRSIGESLLLGLPASEIILATTKPRNLSARNIFAGTVEKIFHLNNRCFVRVSAAVPVTVEIVEGTINALDLHVGKQVFLIIKATSFRRIG